MGHKENAKKLFSKDKIANYWNDLYTNTIYCRDYHFVLRLHEVTKLIASTTKHDAKILDLGCGAGVLSEQLLELGYKVEGADMSDDMLSLASERLARFPSDNYRLFKADCENLSIPDASYDLIACIGVFGYIDEVDTAIREIKRILKPNGTVIISVRNYENLRVFDLFNWLNTLAFKRLGKKRKLTKTTPLDHASQATSTAKNRNFIDIFEKPSKVNRVFGENGLTVEKLIGAGYGPPTYKGTSLLSEKNAIRFSKLLGFVLSKSGLHKFTQKYADISIFLIKSST